MSRDKALVLEIKCCTLGSGPLWADRPRESLEQEFQHNIHHLPHREDRAPTPTPKHPLTHSNTDLFFQLDHPLTEMPLCLPHEMIAGRGKVTSFGSLGALIQR